LFLINQKWGISQLSSIVKTYFLTTPGGETNLNANPENDFEIFKIFLLETFSPKNVQPLFHSLFTFSAYLIIFVLIIYLVYLIKIKDAFLFIIILFTFIVGLVSLLGIGQLKFIPERTAWYFMISVIFITSFFILTIINQNHLFYLFCGFLIIGNSLYPFQDYRYDDELLHIEAKNIYSNFEEPICLISSLQFNQIHSYLKPNLTILPLNSINDAVKPTRKCAKQIIIIDKNKKSLDLHKSRIYTREQVGNLNLIQSINESRLLILKGNYYLESFLLNRGFTTYFQNINGSVLINFEL